MRTPIYLLLTGAVSALLASCNAPAQPDPLSQTFVATGTTRNFTPTQDASLSYVTQNTKLVVGTLQSGGTVQVSMTAAQATSVPMNQFSTYVNRWKTQGCDVSGITVTETQFRFTDALTFTAADGATKVMSAQTVTSNSDGSVTTARVGFWYATAPGQMTGVLKCPGLSPVNYNVTLAAGWNTVTHTWTAKSGANSVDQFDQAKATTHYDGPWYVSGN
ncbi:hypothetical protein [Deinococcus kurensis]|uniref:hypothetical protein n=1 Tax=Deinococcus kurensis TaxID=2662757 RepID=UPI0012D2BCAA|nr:hypothetical protein [Deinococcus kurensis]